MPKTQLPITKGYYKTGSKPVSNQNCVNLYPVIERRRSLVQETLRGVPGVTLVLADEDVPLFDPLDPASEGSHDTDGPTPPDPDSWPAEPDAPLPDKDEDSGEDPDGDRPTYPPSEFPECAPYACDALEASIPSWASFIVDGEPSYGDVFPTPGDVPLTYFANVAAYEAGSSSIDWDSSIHDPVPLNLVDAVGIDPPINICSEENVHVVRRDDEGTAIALYGVASSPYSLPGESSIQTISVTGAKNPSIGQEGSPFRVTAKNELYREDTDALLIEVSSTITCSFQQGRGNPGSLAFTINVNGPNYDESDTYSSSSRNESFSVADNHNLLEKTWLIHVVDCELRSIRKIPIPESPLSRFVQDYWIRYTCFYINADGVLSKNTRTIFGAMVIGNDSSGGVDRYVVNQPCKPQAVYNANALIAGVSMTRSDVPLTGGGADSPFFIDADTFKLAWERNKATYEPPAYC
jgi:hypothetical protein